MPRSRGSSNEAPGGRRRKPGALIIAERLRVIEGAGMHPEPADRAQPGPIDRRLQQVRAEPPPMNSGIRPK